MVFSQGNFSFLNLPTTARISAIGGENVSLNGSDLNLQLSNPALMDTTQQKQLALNYTPYFTQSHFINVLYAPKSSKNRNIVYSFQNLSYGEFDGTDIYGNSTQSFSVNDFAIGAAYSKKIQNISFGLRAKLVGSVFEAYSSVGFLTDWGGTFQHPNKNLTFGILAKNIGFVLKNSTNSANYLPFDLQVGTTFKPQFMPLRFTITAHHLHQFDIVSNNPSLSFEYDQQGNKILKPASFFDKLSRHFIFGSEILFHKNFIGIISYNHLRRKEFSTTEIGGGSGLSVGFVMKTNKINFSFSNARLNRKGFSTFSLTYKFK